MKYLANLHTVSTHIERHSWLERYGAQFGHTMVIFSNLLSKIKVFLDKIWPKMTIVHSLKILDFIRTPAFYMRGYGNQNLEGFQEKILTV